VGNIDEIDVRPNWRLPITAALAAFIFLVGGRIPIPGPGCLQRLSIFALGLLPLFYVLILYEILKLAVPRLAALSVNGSTSRRWVGTVIAALALFFAAAQGFDVYRALAMSGFPGEDTLSTVVAVTTFVAGVALLLFLAEMIRLPGLALGGFWLVLSLSFSANFFAGFANLFELARSGAIDVTTLAVALGMVVAAVLLIVFAGTALSDRVAAAGGKPVLWSPILIWPPFIAGSLADLTAGIAYEFVRDETNPVLWHFTAVWIPAFVGILPLVVVLYARSIRRAFPQEQDWNGKRAVLGLIALAQIAICIGFLLAPEFFPIFLGPGSTLIAVVIVFWALWRVVRPQTVQKRSA
jgi:hypothetical protein